MSKAKTDSLIIGNIQRFSLHDGPGIRTTVFLMGCNLRCPWCANPENLHMEPCRYPDDHTVYGRAYRADELVSEITRDAIFFADGGGVTFSGGEALLQTDALVPVWEQLHRQHINIAVETALFVPLEYIQLAVPFIDHWLIDIKLLTEPACQQILHGQPMVYLKNLAWLSAHSIPYLLRFPLAAGVTDSTANVHAICDTIGKYPPQKLQIFRIHSLAKEKYAHLHLSFHTYPSITDEALVAICEKIHKETNITCEVLQV